MKRALLSCLTIVICLGFLQAAAPESDSGKPEYTSDNHLLPPKNFREWIFLSSGLGMSYTPGSADHQMFTNVFVPQWAYSEFAKSGKWPDKTMFVVEERGSETKGSINKVGHFQSDLMGYGVEVKDETRFPEKLFVYAERAELEVVKSDRARRFRYLDRMNSGDAERQSQSMSDGPHVRLGDTTDLGSKRVERSQRSGAAI
jgi:hypothetical protein